MILIVVEHANGKVSKSTWEMDTAARELAREASRLQTGYVYHYAFAMLIGVVALVTWYLLPR